MQNQSFVPWAELIQIQPRYALRLNFGLYRGKMLESLKGTDASKQAEDSLTYMARLDWPREGKILAPPIWQGWINIEKAKSYPRLYGEAKLV